MASGSVDPAILKALSLDASTARIATHGGSGFASTFKIAGVVAGAADGGGEGTTKSFFVKTGSGPDAEVMFRGEHASLNAIHDAVPDFCPRSHAHGPMEGSPGSFFLATDFLDLRAAAGGEGVSGRLSLAAKLATLHTTPAPAPPEDPNGRPMFGFPLPTCCGSTVQDNSWRTSWAEFYADNRLGGILRSCVRSQGGGDGELERAVERVRSAVVPRLLGDAHLKGVVPVVVHGDLWSGNHGRGRIGGRGAVEEVVFDPSCVYGHSEYELGIMRMFGGFGSSFWGEYEKLVPKSEPVEEWEDRLSLYELYHHLNHYALFGGGYRGGAMAIMKKLIAKYG